MNRAARASRLGVIDPLRKSGSRSSGQKRKTGPLCSSYLNKGPISSYLAAKPYGCQRTFQIPGRGFALRSGCDPEAQSLSRRRDYFFFFAVFLATFLVAALAVFFAFFAFLAISSSMRLSLSERAHVVHLHAQR